MIELNLTRKDFYRFFLERRFRWGRIPTVGLFTVYLRTVLRTPGLKPWPVQRPNPRNNPPFVIENTARKSIPLSVIARKNLIHLSLRGAKRRSNPEKERWYTGLLRFARNESHATACLPSFASRNLRLASLRSQ